MEYGGHQCSDTDLPKVEADLRAKGYRLVNKTNEKYLTQGEYIKSSLTGSEQSFEGPKNVDGLLAHKVRGMA